MRAVAIKIGPSREWAARYTAIQRLVRTSVYPHDRVTGSMKGDVKRHFLPSTGGGESSPWAMQGDRADAIRHGDASRGYDAVRFQKRRKHGVGKVANHGSIGDSRPIAFFGPS